MKKLILASASPRRRELLAKAGFSFEVKTSDVDEAIGMMEAPLLVRELALLKAAAVAKTVREDCLVLGADTVVSAGGEILGKPKDWRDARRMLRLYPGGHIRSIPAYVLWRRKRAAPYAEASGRTFCFAA